MTDASGLVFLRARYYDPATGRFVSRDTWEGEYQNPISLGKWNYAYANPLIFADPTGRFPIPIASCGPVLAAALSNGGVNIVFDAGLAFCLALVGITVIAAAPVLYQAAPEVAEQIDSLVCQLWPNAQIVPEQNPTPNPKEDPWRFPPPLPRIPDTDGKPRSNSILYHYTRAENIPSILAMGLRPSIGLVGSSSSDAQWGDGQYFTDLTPMEAAMATRSQVSYSLYRDPWKFGSPRSRLYQIGWLAVDVTGLPVQRAAPLFGTRFPSRSIYLNPTIALLNVTSRLRGTGMQDFLVSPSGYN